MKKTTCFVLGMLATLGTGCAGSVRWTPLDEIRRPRADDHPKASTVVLLRQSDYRVNVNVMVDSTWTAHHHGLVAITREAGMAAAKFEVSYPTSTALVSLHARTIAPDGTTRELASRDVYTTRGTGEQRADGESRAEQTLTRFQYPGAVVGSVLEYDYVLTFADLPRSLERFVDEDSPVLRHRVSFEVTDTTSFSVKLYNAERPIERSEGGGYRKVAFELTHLPAYKHEPWQPPVKRFRPRWAFHLDENRYRARSYPIMASWGEALSWHVKKLYGQTTAMYAGVDLQAPTAGVDGKRAAITRAVQFVRDRTELKHFISDFDGIRPMREVLQTKLANNLEKAVLLRGLLDARGIQSRYAFVARDRAHEFDRDFAVSTTFDHLIVQVPVQAGVEASLFIDPSCEACAPGELPSWSGGRDALVFSGRPGVGGPPTPEYEFLPTPVPTNQNLEQWTWTFDLDERGDAAVMAEQRLQGNDAVNDQIARRTQSSQARRDAIERELRKRIASLSVQAIELDTFDKVNGTFDKKVRGTASALASRAGDHLLVPLSALTTWYRYDSGEPRKHGAYINGHWVDDETITLRLPAGWVVDELPKTKASTALGWAVEFDVTHKGQMVQVHRHYVRSAGSWQAEDFAPVAEQLNAFNALRDESIVLRRQ